MLDQALAVGGGRIDTQQVLAAFGGAPFEQRLAVLEAAAAEDVAGALVGVHDLVASGHDVRRVADDLLRTVRDAFIQANASGRVPYDGAPEECARLVALAKEMGNAAVVRAIEILGDAIVDIRGQAVADPRLVLEVAVVRIARREARTREETLLDRVERLEQRLAERRACRARPSPRGTAAAPARPRRFPAVRCSPAANGARSPPRRAPAPAAPPAARRPSRNPLPLPTPRRPAPDLRARRRHRGVARDPRAPQGSGRAPASRTRNRSRSRTASSSSASRSAASTRSTSASARKRPRSRRRSPSRLGAAPRFMLRPHDFDVASAFKPPPGSQPAAGPIVDEEPPPEDDHEFVDLTELSDAPDVPQLDTVNRLVTNLGAEVIDERRRG